MNTRADGRFRTSDPKNSKRKSPHGKPFVPGDPRIKPGPGRPKGRKNRLHVERDALEASAPPELGPRPKDPLEGLWWYENHPRASLELQADCCFKRARFMYAFKSEVDLKMRDGAEVMRILEEGMKRAAQGRGEQQPALPAPEEKPATTAEALDADPL